MDFDINTEKTCFPHPISGDLIFIMPDLPHMLKLVRNTLGDRKIIYNEYSKPILWEYIEKRRIPQNIFVGNAGTRRSTFSQ